MVVLPKYSFFLETNWGNFEGLADDILADWKGRHCLKLFEIVLGIAVLGVEREENLITNTMNINGKFDAVFSGVGKATGI